MGKKMKTEALRNKMKKRRERGKGGKENEENEEGECDFFVNISHTLLLIIKLT